MSSSRAAAPSASPICAAVPRRRVAARREIILAGGAINSPQLLKLSGIGPGEELRRHGIELVRHLPGVGENLQDHLEFYFQVACKEPITLYSSMGPLAKALIGLRWLLRKDGLGATNHFESCGFIRSRAGIRYPDIQYHFLPLAVSYDGRSRRRPSTASRPMSARCARRAADGSGSPRPIRARSRAFCFNYMSHPDDWEEMRACVRLTREIFAQAAFDRYRGREIQPGSDIVSDDAIDAFIRAKVESAFHPSCTCRMGSAGDPMAVVDSETRVLGVEGLRVVDASIMPSITTGNLNAPTLMIGEKASDHILGREMLPASNAPFYVAPDWETQQR